MPASPRMAVATQITTGVRDLPNARFSLVKETMAI